MKTNRFVSESKRELTAERALLGASLAALAGFLGLAWAILRKEKGDKRDRVIP